MPPGTTGRRSSQAGCARFPGLPKDARPFGGFNFLQFSVVRQRRRVRRPGLRFVAPPCDAGIAGARSIAISSTLKPCISTWALSSARANKALGRLVTASGARGSSLRIHFPELPEMRATSGTALPWIGFCRKLPKCRGMIATGLRIIAAVARNCCIGAAIQTDAAAGASAGPRGGTAQAPLISAGRVAV